ncbi:RNA polymerase subunit sigma [Bordetella sp. N]|nr:sigma-70 family RNA polymerase sigma factor [Bordetella sp. N]ALM87306.1 RNA polymerase subunit sigma [Bordetella sp. N]
MPPSAAGNALCPDTAQSFTTLYRSHHAWLTGWLRSRVGCQNDAADLAQDTFIRVLQSSVAASLREPRTYLATVARGLVIDLWRRRALEQAYLQVLATLPEEHQPSLEAQALVKERLIKLDRMLDGLGGKVKQAFLMAMFDGAGHAAIAQSLGISVRTVGDCMAKAMARCCLLLD